MMRIDAENLNRHMIQVGTLRERLDVLALACSEDGAAYFWKRVRGAWAAARMETRRVIFSSSGTSARGVTFTIRRDEWLTLGNAYAWNGQHCFLTDILRDDPNRGFWTVRAALCESVTLTAKPQKRTGRDTLNRPKAVEVSGFTFPGILTERYFRNEADDISRAETQQRVLIAPKAITLRAGDLVQRGEETPYTVRQVMDLDAHRNEFLLERRSDA